MRNYLIRRTIQFIPLLIIISIFSFYLLHTSPHDPLDHLRFDYMGRERTYEEMESLKKVYGLHRPWYYRYVIWVKNLLQGDLGYSRIFQQPVFALMKDRIWNSLQLNVFAFLISIPLAIVVGIYSALRQYSWGDYLATFLTFFGRAMPLFWLAIMVLIIFGAILGWFPMSGMSEIGYDIENVGWWKFLLDRLHHMFMPGMVLVFSGMTGYVRYVRSSFLEVIRLDYIRTARAKGLSERVVIYKHAFRNAMIPIITLLGFEIPGLFGGALIVEQIFAWPGIGYLVWQAVRQKDFILAITALMFYTLLTLIGMLLADVFYAIADPRIKYE